MLSREGSKFRERERRGGTGKKEIKIKTKIKLRLVEQKQQRKQNKKEELLVIDTHKGMSHKQESTNKKTRELVKPRDYSKIKSSQRLIKKRQEIKSCA